MKGHGGKTLKEVFEGSRDKFEHDYGLPFRLQGLSRKSSELWEAAIQTPDRVRVYKGEGNTQTEALVDAFNKAKQALDQEATLGA